MIGPQRSAWRSWRREPVSAMTLVAAALCAAFAVLSTAKAEEQSKCVPSPHLLWGDGEHDDTAALNAWFRGETVVWAQTHEKVGAEIADHPFLLSSVVYISSGICRTLARFRMVWPERQGTGSGRTIPPRRDPRNPPPAPA